jgi:hypothetical protein
MPKLKLLTLFNMRLRNVNLPSRALAQLQSVTRKRLGPRSRSTDLPVSGVRRETHRLRVRDRSPVSSVAFVVLSDLNDPIADLRPYEFGRMFWLWWKTLSGSYVVFTSTSRS